MTAIAVLKPTALRQIIIQADYFPGDFPVLAEQLIRKYCKRFVERLDKWKHLSTKPNDLIFNMVYYHQLWEGFSSDEPWSDSENKPITYFLDINYTRRLEEMGNNF